ncbi:MAG: glycosyltransferase, partial [Candidatus Anammoxibacter sp.]
MSEKEKPEISVIVPIVERYDDLRKLYSEFSAAFDKLGKPYEFIFIVDGGFSEVTGELQDIQANNSSIKIIKLTRKFGESIAISIGVEKARGEYIFTLASYFQVEPECINPIWSELNNGYDLVITRRYPRIDSIFNRIQSFVFHWIINKITSTRFHDMSCGVKGMKAIIFKEINIYADLHRFIPILADKYGFKIKEINAKQRKEDTTTRLLKSGAYIRRLLDIFTIFFITKFTMKPLRFFGLIGIVLGGIG